METNDSNGNKISGDEENVWDDEYFTAGQNISNYAYQKHNKEHVLKSNSTDDDLSEYTDPEESSAPTELLAEFLSAVMLRDYFKAYDYCKRILEYEPNNKSAKEFFPLIVTKLEAQQYKDSNFPQSEDEDEGDEELDDNFRWQMGESSDLSSPKSSVEEEESGDEVDDIPESEGVAGGCKPKKSDSTTESYSSVLQEEDEIDDCDNEELLMSLRDFTNGNPVKLSPTTDSDSSELLTKRFVDIIIAENGNGTED